MSMGKGGSGSFARFDDESAGSGPFLRLFDLWPTKGWEAAMIGGEWREYPFDFLKSKVVGLGMGGVGVGREDAQLGGRGISITLETAPVEMCVG